MEKMNTTNAKQELFMKLYNPVEGNLSAFCFAKTRNRDDAKELVSETVLCAYENLHTLKAEKAFLSFLFTIASNINKVRYKNNQRFVVSEPELFEMMYSDTVQSDVLTDIKILYEALDKLPLLQKEAIYLYDILGMSQKEIAAIQNSTVINTKLRIHRGKKRLAEILRDETKPVKSKIVGIKEFESIEEYENE